MESSIKHRPHRRSPAEKAGPSRTRQVVQSAQPQFGQTRLGCGFHLVKCPDVGHTTTQKSSSWKRRRECTRTHRSKDALDAASAIQCSQSLMKERIAWINIDKQRAKSLRQIKLYKHGATRQGGGSLGSMLDNVQRFCQALPAGQIQNNTQRQSSD